MSRLAVFLATCGFSGYFPIAPGTIGSLVGLGIHWVARALDAPWWADVPLIAAVFGVGVWAATAAEEYFGRSDPGQVVLDEVLGMLLTLAFMDVSVSGAFIGFFLFRLFDVVKPWPANQLELLPGGLGVMSDDAMAGLYAHVALRLTAWLVPAWVFT